MMTAINIGCIHDSDGGQRLPMGPIWALMALLDPGDALDPQFRWSHLGPDGLQPWNHWWAPNGTAGPRVANALEWVLPHVVVWSFRRLWSVTPFRCHLLAAQSSLALVRFKFFWRKTNNLKDPKTPTRPQEPEERDDPMYIWFCIGPFNVEINLGLWYSL